MEMDIDSLMDEVSGGRRLYVAGVILFGYDTSRPLETMLALLLATALLIAWNLAHRQGNGLLTVTFLDVGQGDSLCH